MPFSHHCADASNLPYAIHPGTVISLRIADDVIRNDVQGRGTNFASGLPGAGQGVPRPGGAGRGLWVYAAPPVRTGHRRQRGAFMPILSKQNHQAIPPHRPHQLGTGNDAAPSKRTFLAIFYWRCH
jgi:hypothetical protein